ncbi:MAG TPA: efflux RND transporter periplasmic adaptor subunit [Acetobacteraceae bacterium]|nr:efflux RND transporter periplasmic adaptor subunit [Acetobacteraceae bacterium]
MVRRVGLGRTCCPAIGLASLFMAVTPLRAANPPPAVTVATVQVEDVAPVSSFVGRVAAIQSVQIAARVTAFMENVAVKEGSDVKAGQLLFELQKAPYQAAVQAAQASLDKANAAYRQSQLAYERQSQLRQQGVSAQATLDQALATRDSDAADVLAAQANVATAALNLSYCTIVSPIDGRIGAVAYTKGNLVTPSSQPLATVNQMDPIRAVFSVTDRDIVSVKQRTGATQNQIAASLTLQLQLANGKQYDQAGKIAFVNNQVDPATGTVTVYADFPNPVRLLLPGAFATVQVRRSQPEKRPVVPVAAVQTDQQGRFVLLVGSDNKVAQQAIEIGRQIAQDFIVTKGLNGGERVIVQGVQKVRAGEVVNPTVAAAATANGQGANGTGG